MHIDITNVHKRYGDVVALDGVDLAVDAGGTYGLVGTNGAGKSTLFRLLAGHERPDEGRLTVGGRSVDDAGWRIREEIGFLPEDPGFPPGESGREVLGFHADVRGVSDDRVPAVLETVGLADAADRGVGGYSTGMTRRLGLAAALLARPSVLLLDEPTSGLDPNGVAALRGVLRRLREETAVTVLLASHALQEVERVCDEVGVLHDGRLVAEGSPAELAAGFGNDAGPKTDADPGNANGPSTGTANGAEPTVADGLERAFVELTGGGRDV